MAVRRKYIKRFARDLLEEFGVTSPPVPVEQIAKQLGAQINEAPDGEDLSGFMLRDQTTGEVVIGVNKAHGEHRRRFTIAHELAHMLLHDQEQLHVDSSRRLQLIRRSGQSSDGNVPIEIEANVFAAEFLMPADLLEEDLLTDENANINDVSVIRTLANRYKVSNQAMTFRLANLGYIDI